MKRLGGFLIGVGLALFFLYIGRKLALNIIEKEAIQPGDFVYCQFKDDVVGDWRIGRVLYLGEDTITIKGGQVPFLVDDYSEYGLIQPFIGSLSYRRVVCGKIDLSI